MYVKLKSLLAPFVAALFLFALGTLAANTTQSPVPSQCNATSLCNHGTCNLASGNCVCDQGYVTADARKPCGYEQKVAYTALMLHAFTFGFGGGYFYVGWTAYGIGAVSLASTALYFAALTTRGCAAPEGFLPTSIMCNARVCLVGWSAFVAVLASIGSLALWAYHLDQFVRLGGQGIIGDLVDGNGYPLY